MKIKVRVFANLRDIVGKKELDLQPARGTTVKTLIDLISEKYSKGKLRRELLDEKENIRKYVKILVNGRDIDFLNGSSTELKDGDIVAIFPPVGGG